MARPGKHFLAGQDLQTGYQTLLEISDSRFRILDLPSPEKFEAFETYAVSNTGV
jgi:hypothetical protein